MNSPNTIPSTHKRVVTLGAKALAGAQAIGTATGLLHHPASAIAVDVHDYIGDPGVGAGDTPPALGKRGLYCKAKADALIASVAAQVHRRAGSDFCAKALGSLKPSFGYLWNLAWSTAGFTMGTLAKPYNPVALLIELRAYFRANPARESADQEITAAKADEFLAELEAAQQSAAGAKAAMVAAKAASDASFKKLRERLSGLRRELSELLSDDDGRWYAFGFHRPADGSMPMPVPDLVLTAAGPGTVLVQWGFASLAEDYRVTWRLNGNVDVEEPREIGLFTDRQAALTNLPSGESIIVGVSARNDSGETTPTESMIRVT